MLGDLVLATVVVVGIFALMFSMGSGKPPRYRRRAIAFNEQHGGVRPSWETEDLPVTDLSRR